MISFIQVGYRVKTWQHPVLFSMKGTVRNIPFPNSLLMDNGNGLHITVQTKYINKELRACRWMVQIFILPDGYGTTLSQILILTPLVIMILYLIAKKYLYPNLILRESGFGASIFREMEMRTAAGMPWR